jgi:hypothetical protein
MIRKMCQPTLVDGPVRWAGREALILRAGSSQVHQSRRAMYLARRVRKAPKAAWHGADAREVEGREESDVVSERRHGLRCGRSSGRHSCAKDEISM